MAKKPELYLSIDIEADGPSPLRSSMLSFAIAAITIEKVLVDLFTRNLEEQVGSMQHPGTMAWWRQTPERWQVYLQTRENTTNLNQAMDEFRTWVEGLKASYQLCPVAWPTGYDYMWINAYATRYGREMWPENPLGNACLDGKSFAFGRDPFKRYRDLSKRTYPSVWFDKFPHTHVASDDAIEQGCLIVNAVREARNLPRIEGFNAA